jgi:predicted transcriptional regulator
VGLRCNAPQQRQPKAPDTEWGRPRGALGWSLRDLAEKTGINAGELSRIERGRSCPSRDQARRILDAYAEAGQ